MKYCTNIGIDTHSKKNSVCAIVAGGRTECAPTWETAVSHC